MTRYGVMRTDVHLLGTCLKLKKNQMVKLKQATNLPNHIEDKLWFASLPEWYEHSSILINEDDFYFVPE